MTVFSIVEFSEVDDQNSVAIVPSAWIDFKSKTCYWPPKIGSSLTKLVKSAKPPDLSWSVVPYLRILVQASTYELARQKEKTAEETSNLETESEEKNSKTTRGKRRAKKTPKPASSSSSDTDNEESDSDSGLNLYGITETPKEPETKESAVTDQHLTVEVKEDVNPSTSVDGSQAILQNLQIITEGSHNETQPGSSTYVLDVNNPENLVASKQDFILLQNQLQVFAEKVFTILEHQEEAIKEIQASLLCLKGPSQTLPDFTKVPPHPLKTRESISEIEEWLQTAAHFNLLVDKLSLAGGTNLQKNTRKILKKVFAPGLAIDVNFTGKGKKVALKKLKLLEAIKGAVRTKFANASDDEIEELCINWFRSSKSRNGRAESSK